MAETSGKDFEAVFDRHFEQVYGYVAYRLAPDTHTAGDVTQETFLAALKNWAAFRGEGSVLTWLRSIARRKIADHFRKRGRVVEAREADSPISQSQVESDSTIDRALLVAGVMQSLVDGQAELLEDKYLEGLSVREIAQRRGGSEQSVASALFRARQAFREQYLRLQTKEEIQQ